MLDRQLDLRILTREVKRQFIFVSLQSSSHKVESHPDVSTFIGDLFAHELVRMIIDQLVEYSFVLLLCFSELVETRILFRFHNVNQLLTVIGLKQELAVAHCNRRVLLSER